MLSGLRETIRDGLGTCVWQQQEPLSQCAGGREIYGQPCENYSFRDGLLRASAHFVGEKTLEPSREVSGEIYISKSLQYPVGTFYWWNPNRSKGAC